MRKKLAKLLNIFLVMLLIVSCFFVSPLEGDAKRTRSRKAGTSQTYRYKSTKTKRRSSSSSRGRRSSKVTRRATYRPKARVTKKRVYKKSNTRRPTTRRSTPKVTRRQTQRKATNRRTPTRKATPQKRSTPKKKATRNRKKAGNAANKNKSNKSSRKQSGNKNKSSKGKSGKNSSSKKKGAKSKKGANKKSKKSTGNKKSAASSKKATTKKTSKKTPWYKKAFNTVKKVGKSALYVAADLVGVSDWYTLVTGKDLRTGKKASRLAAAAWIAVGFIPVGKLGKLAKVALKGTKIAKFGGKILKVGAKVAGKVAKFAKPLVKVGKAALKKGIKASKRIVKSAATKLVKNGTRLASKIGKALFKKGSKSSAVRHTVKKGLGIVKSTVKKGVGAAKKTVTSKVVKTGKKIVQTFKKSKVGKAANKVAEVHRTVKKKVQQFGDNVYSKLESKLSKESKDLAEAACFVKGTKVLTDTGYRGIETIKVGDQVFAKDVAKQSQGYETVSRVFVHEVHTIVTLVVAKQTIKTTEEHPFYVSGKGWVPAKDLTASDRLINGDNEAVKITSISTETLDQPVKVYNFEVANAHTYYVSSETILVHNDCRQVPKKKASGSNPPKTDFGAENPVSEKDWNNYFKDKYGAGNVKWKNPVNSVDDIINTPSSLTNVNPTDIVGFVEKEGWTVTPLKKGGHAGVPYEQGGGFSMNPPAGTSGSSRYIQYHPGGGHHGDLPYYKVSSPEHGITRIYTNGKVVKE